MKQILVVLTAFTSLTSAAQHMSGKDSVNSLSNKMPVMARQTNSDDSLALSALNKQFIQNFLRQDAVAHAKIIHPDFVCIESSGNIVRRDVYLKNWATDYDNSGYTSFSYGDESIRIFNNNTALVRAKTTYTLKGKTVKGHKVYTDTYIKQNGQWLCVQAQITPVAAL